MSGRPVAVGCIIDDVPDQLARELILYGKAQALADDPVLEQADDPQPRRGRRAER